MIKELNIKKANTCNCKDTIQTIAQQMKETSARHLFVTDEENNLKGIISPVDIVEKAVATGKDNTTTAEEIMSIPVDSVEVNEEAEHAMRIMINRHTYTCPVTQEGKLKGIVEYQEVAARVLKNLQEEERK